MPANKEDKGGSSKHHITLVFIVNGEEVSVAANPSQPLKAARAKALAESQNTGRPPDEWEVCDQAGTPLSADDTIGSLGLQDGARLYLSLKVGAGGR